MPEWFKVLIGVLILTVIPPIPAVYVEYLWVISRQDDHDKATSENNKPERNQSNPLPFSAPVEPRTTEHNPISSNTQDQSSDSEMKPTDWLLVLVGFLQFGRLSVRFSFIENKPS